MQLTSDSAIVCHRLSVPSITGGSVYLYKAALPNPPTCYAVLFIHLRSLRLICLFPLVWHNTLTGAHYAAWVIYVCNKKSAKLWWSIHPKTCKLSVRHIPLGRRFSLLQHFCYTFNLHHRHHLLRPHSWCYIVSSTPCSTALLTAYTGL